MVAKIASVEARTVVVPLSQPKSFSTRRVDNRHYSLVRVTDEDGATGIGFCYGGSAAGAIVTAAVRELIASSVVGVDRTLVRMIWERAYANAILHGRTGSVMRALSAVDIAIWDLNARRASLPLWRYLGGAVEAKVPAYASGGYYMPGKDPAALAEEMKHYVQLGFRAVKMKVGMVSAGEDAERIAAVRSSVGPDVLVMLDANNAWHDLPTALRALRRWEPLDPYWIEEPFGPDDLDNHARLVRSTPITVAMGEIEAGRWRHRAILEAEAAQVLQTDAAVCGGITEFLRIAATADSYGVSLSPHWFHDLHIHLVAATPNAQYVEFFLDDEVLNFRSLISHQLEHDGAGSLLLPERPGLGFDWNDAAVDQYATDEWN